MAEKQNPMREIKIEKIILKMGAKGDALEKAMKLLKLITGRTPSRRKTRKRIPNLGVRPGLEIGAMVTIRKEAEEMLKKMLTAIDNVIRKRQLSENNFSFGIKEYLEIPGMEYQRDIGIMGLDVTVVFKRTGRRVRLKKIKRGKIPKRQNITKQEIIKFMEDKFQTKFIGKA
jgi:large subunit ribosomal protein L5